MKSIFKIAVTNILNKKVQSILILVVIMISAIGFSTSVGILSSINSPFEKTYDRLKGPDLTLCLDNKIYNSESIKKWWENKKGIETVSDLNTYALVAGPSLNGKKLSSNFYLCETIDSLKKINNLQFIEGKKTEAPGKAEIWVPTGLAYSNNIKLGDELGITVPEGIKTFKVSAIVVDPVFSSQMINPTRVWIQPGSLEKLYSKGSLNGSLLSFKFVNKSDESKFMKDFENYLGAPFSGFTVDRSLIMMSYTMMYKIIGIVMLIFAVILMLITIYIMASVISDAIVSDYKKIGILKSNGFTPGNIVSIYIIQVLIMAFIAIPLGIFVSSFMIAQLEMNLLKILGIANLNLPMMSLFIMVFLIMASILLISSFFTAWKAGRVNSADAIRYGEPYDAKKKRKSGIKISKSLPVPLSIGLNQIFTYKKQIAFSFVMFAVTAFVTVFSINSFESIKSMTKERAAFGFDNSDVTVVSYGKEFGVDTEKVVSWIKSDKRVKKVLPSTYIMSGVIPKDDKNPSMSIIGTTYDGDMSIMELQNEKGSNPTNENEISIATNTALKYNKKVGDGFSIYLEGKLLKFKVSGIYQSLSNMGQGYRVTMTGIRRASPDFELGMILVKLKNIKDADQFSKDITNVFKNKVDTMISEKDFTSVMDPITKNMGVAVVFISFIFILVLIVTLVSSTVLFIHKNKKVFGIYKTIGLTPNQARLSIISKNLMVAFIAGIIGTLLSIYVLAPSMTMMVKSMGIIRFPFVINTAGTLAVLPLMLLLCFLSSWMPSGQILKINSRILLNE